MTVVTKAHVDVDFKGLNTFQNGYLVPECLCGVSLAECDHDRPCGRPLAGNIEYEGCLRFLPRGAPGGLAETCPPCEPLRPRVLQALQALRADHRGRCR